MHYIDAFRADGALIEKFGEGNAHLVWTLSLYLENPDVEALASEALTDGPNDKKIDFIYLDRDLKRLIFAQGYYASSSKDSAPANKASDLNTAAAWFMSGDLEQVPEQLRSTIVEARVAILEGDVESVDLLFVHNLPESINVQRELQTAAEHFRKALGDETNINIAAREFGTSIIDNLYAAQESHIEIKDDIICPAAIKFREEGPDWQAAIVSVPGVWLHELYNKYSDQLFSANYRGFLGITRRRRINTGIRQSAESKPMNFWVFNNGITLLTLDMKDVSGGVQLAGLSIINGAQTTGSIGSVDRAKNDITNVKVLCRIIRCNNEETIGEIVRYNNSQNEIMTWDQYSNDPEQKRIESELKDLGYKYSRRRGFRSNKDEIGIEEVAQPLLAFHGRHQDANRSKNLVFDRKPLYNESFEGAKGRHILFVYALARAIDERRIQLKAKSSDGTAIAIELTQLELLRIIRFKYFMMTVISKILEPIVGRKVDVKTVAFSKETIMASDASIDKLAAHWMGIVQSALTFMTTISTASDFSAQISDDAFLQSVIQKVSAMMYATNAAEQFKTFAGLVTDS